MLTIPDYYWASLLMPFSYYFISIVIIIGLQILHRKWTISFLGAYMFLVFSYTFLKRDLGDVLFYGFVPFWSYITIFIGTPSPVSANELIIQIIANILLFIPIGIFSGKIWRWKGLIVGFSFSALIEVLQLIFKRGMFEFDDIMHNTLGTLLGISIALFFSRILKKNEKD